MRDGNDSDAADVVADRFTGTADQYVAWWEGLPGRYAMTMRRAAR